MNYANKLSILYSLVLQHNNMKESLYNAQYKQLKNILLELLLFQYAQQVCN